MVGLSSNQRSSIINNIYHIQIFIILTDAPIKKEEKMAKEFIGLISLLSFDTIAYLFFGVFLGIVVGSLPGLTATMAVSILISLTYGLSATNAIVVLISVYLGGI